MNMEVGTIKKGCEIGKGQYANKYILHACIYCGKERWVLFVKGRPYSLSCLTCANRINGKNRVGRYSMGKSGTWKGGRTIKKTGYVLITLAPDDFYYSMCDKSGRVPEHRLIVAKALGRCLHPWELVHHKHAKYPAGSVEDKQDNRYPENLQLVQEMQHRQITLLEKRIKYLEGRVTILEAENILLNESHQRSHKEVKHG
ncbi:hypothetical protein LCGC14_2154920 [marine sediment metagenome]|uniref:HNH nuclease domain-containing protein n=1 Tax=marine sediment metagenome TaxID=412755 RepID=A0A0F9EGQ4_9ZZZZ